MKREEIIERLTESAEAAQAESDEGREDEELFEALATLRYRERRVLEMRYGLDGEPPRTLTEIGKSFNVTGERVRQISNHGLTRLSETLAAGNEHV